MRCTVCDGATSRLFKHEDYWIRVCAICRHRVAEVTLSASHVARIYDDTYFEGGEAGYTNYLSEAPILRAHGSRYGRLLTHYTRPGAVLDVGAAAGFVLKGFMDEGWCGCGLEPNPRMAEYARTQLGLRMVTGSLEEFHTNERYDLISMIQVIAHFVDPRQALEAAQQVTRPGGFWLIETWNRESWTARAFGKHWHEYSPPSVLQWFSPDGLCRLAAQFGFREAARGRPSKWINAAHAKSLLRYRLKDSRLDQLFAHASGLIPDRLALPYPAEDLFWILFQKS